MDITPRLPSFSFSAHFPNFPIDLIFLPTILPRYHTFVTIGSLSTHYRLTIGSLSYFESRPGSRSKSKKKCAPRRRRPHGPPGTHSFAPIDFYEAQAVFLPNLKPSADGLLRIPLSELQVCQRCAWCLSVCLSVVYWSVHVSLSVCVPLSVSMVARVCNVLSVSVWLWLSLYPCNSLRVSAHTVLFFLSLVMLYLCVVVLVVMMKSKELKSTLMHILSCCADG